MTYKNRQIQLEYLREYRDTHREEAWWSQTLWNEKYAERKKELCKKAWNKNKKFYYCVRKLERKFKNISDDLLFIKVTKKKTI